MWATHRTPMHLCKCLLCVFKLCPRVCNEYLEFQIMPHGLAAVLCANVPFANVINISVHKQVYLFYSTWLVLEILSCKRSKESSFSPQSIEVCKGKKISGIATGLYFCNTKLSKSSILTFLVLSHSYFLYLATYKKDFVWKCLASNLTYYLHKYQDNLENSTGKITECIDCSCHTILFINSNYIANASKKENKFFTHTVF